MKGLINMLKMNLNEIKNFKGVRKGSVNVNLNSIPKKGMKKVVNDRVKTSENVNNGTSYGLPTYAEINIGSSSVACVELMVRLTEMIKDESRGSSYYTCFLEEKTLGTFKASFDDLRVGKIEKIIEKELNRYFGNIEEVRHEYETVIGNMDEQLKITEHELGKALSEKQEFQFKYVEADKMYSDEFDAHEKTKVDLKNALVVVENQKNEIVELKEKIKTVKALNKDKKLSRLVWRKLIREIVVKYNSGTSIDKLIDFVLDFLEK